MSSLSGLPSSPRYEYTIRRARTVQTEEEGKFGLDMGACLTDRVVCNTQALEGKDVKDLLSNVGSGGAAAAPAAGGAAAAGGAVEEAKAEEKEEG